MTEQQYRRRRGELVSEIITLRRHGHFLRCVNHRIRQIAKLDNEHDGTPIEETLRFFDYKPIV